MTKMNKNNGKETKLDTFPRDIFKFGAIFFLPKTIDVFQ